MMSDLFDLIFWQQFISTIFGVALGIPLGFFLEWLRKSRARKDAIRIELSLLENIIEELNWNLTQINVGGVDLKATYWNAISSAGLISHIESANLLNRITSAYFSIETTQYIQRIRGKLLLSANSSERERANDPLSDLNEHRARLSENCRVAVSRIENRITSIKRSYKI